MSNKESLKKIAITICLIVALFSLSPLFTQSTDNTLAAPLLEITLARTDYAPNEAIGGSIDLVFNSSFSADTIFNLKFGDAAFHYKISEIFTALNTTYQALPGQMIGTNPSTQKILIINKDQPKKAGLILPPNLDAGAITDFDFSISGQDYNNNFLQFPYIDFLQDGNNEWYYFGAFTNWGSEVKPAGLASTADKQVGVSKNNTLYCQLIDLPLSKKFNITAQYKKVAADDIKALLALVLDATGDAASAVILGGCDLPEPAIGSTMWGTCEISLANALQGQSLVCIYSQLADPNAQLTTFNLPADSKSPHTGYFCDEVTDMSAGVELIGCTNSYNRDYFIKLRAADYSGNFNKSTTLATELQLPLLNTMIEEYSNACQPTPEGECLVIFELGGLNEGKIILDSLKLKYHYAGAEESSDKFFDVNETPAIIYGIGGMPLSNNSVLVTIPLTFFANLTTPKNFTGESKVVALEAWLDNFNKSSKNIIIYKNATPTGIDDIEQELLQKQSALGSITSSPDEGIQKVVALKKIGAEINSALSKITELQGKVGALKMSTLPRSENLNQLNTIKSELNNLTASLIEGVSFTQTLSDITPVEPADIIDEVIPEGYESDDVYFMQEKIQVTTDLKKFSIKKAGAETTGYLVKKKIKALENLGSIDVYEIIGKNAASSLTEVVFEDAETPTTINQDPIVKWTLSSLGSGSEKTFYYLIDNSLGFDITELKTVVFFAGGEETGGGENETAVECGDGVCTVPLEDKFSCPQDCEAKRPWWLIIAIISAVIVIAFYLNLYRGKGNFRELTRGKNPFKNEADLKAVMEYIKASKDKGTADDKITDALMGKGWSEKQIKFAFEELAWHKELDLKTKNPPRQQTELQPMREYIERAIQKGMNKQEILSSLTQAGWNFKQVRRAYRKIKIRFTTRLFFKKITFR